MFQIRENFLTEEEVNTLIQAFAPKLHSIAHLVPFTETALGFENSNHASK
jgi:hypothetical protein